MIGILIEIDEGEEKGFKFILKTKTITITSKSYKTIDHALRAVSFWEDKLNTRVCWTTVRSHHKFVLELLDLGVGERRIRMRIKKSNDVTHIVRAKKKAKSMALAKKRRKIAMKERRAVRKADLAWMKTITLPKINMPIMEFLGPKTKKECSGSMRKKGI
jgi:hypothetical protein